MLHGWIILDKPVGLGSTQAVSAVKRLLREAGEPKTKVGHGGTLDPLAGGVLPIALGEATKLAGRMLDAMKQYIFSIRFGVETDTLDAEGQVLSTNEIRPIRKSVEALLPRFTGEIEQIPPVYSALKVGGKAAYARARAGERVDLMPRLVTVLELAFVSALPVRSESGLPAINEEGAGSLLRSLRERQSAENAGKNERVCEVTLAAVVSKGTYIRSLARDIAHALGTVGYVSHLRRIRAGRFTSQDAISLDFLSEAAKARELTRVVLPLEAALDDIPALPVTPDQAQLLRHGQKLFGIPAPPGLCMAILEGTPVALVEATADGLRVVRGFNL